jgi:hypothetical protein
MGEHRRGPQSPSRISRSNPSNPSALSDGDSAVLPPVPVAPRVPMQPWGPSPAIKLIRNHLETHRLAAPIQDGGKVSLPAHFSGGPEPVRNAATVNVIHEPAEVSGRRAHPAPRPKTGGAHHCSPHFLNSAGLAAANRGERPRSWFYQSGSGGDCPRISGIISHLSSV